MDKETLGAAVRLDVEITQLEHYLNRDNISIHFVKCSNGMEYLDFYNDSAQIFRSEDDDSEYVNRIKELIVDYLQMKLSEKRKEFKDL